MLLQGFQLRSSTVNDEDRPSTDADHEAASIDTPVRRTAMRALMAFVTLVTLGCLILPVALGAPVLPVLGVISFAVSFMALVFRLIVIGMWMPWQKRYPARAIRASAVSKIWQSFAFGSLARMNNCITITADDQCLHLDAFAPMRWVGAKRISLPLNRIADVARGRFINWEMTATIDGTRITGPAWCLELAAPGAPQTTPKP